MQFIHARFLILVYPLNGVVSTNALDVRRQMRSRWPIKSFLLDWNDVGIRVQRGLDLK